MITNQEYKKLNSVFLMEYNSIQSKVTNEILNYRTGVIDAEQTLKNIERTLIEWDESVKDKIDKIKEVG